MSLVIKTEEGSQSLDLVQGYLSVLDASDQQEESLDLVQKYTSMLDVSDAQVKEEVDRVKTSFQTALDKQRQVISSQAEEHALLQNQLALARGQFEALKLAHDQERTAKNQVIQIQTTTIQTQESEQQAIKPLEQAFLEMLKIHLSYERTKVFVPSPQFDHHNPQYKQIATERLDRLEAVYHAEVAKIQKSHPKLLENL